MKILVIGGGGREHAIAWKLSNSPLVSNVFVAPGNGGTANENKVTNVTLSSPAEISRFIKNNKITYTVIGPEQPLAEGLVDYLLNEKLAVIGPRQNSAMLESSKAFCKDMLVSAKIKTAAYKTFTVAKDAVQYINQKGVPIVIKADGLAAGKGVVVAVNKETALQAIEDIMVKKIYGSAGEKVVIEDCLIGEEASFIVLTDGKNIAPLCSAKDHKRLFDNDQGPNTGGMGVITPSSLITHELQQEVIDKVIAPMINLLNEKMPYKPAYQGFLYAGLMIDKAKNINVLEFNCRLGDPETQPLLMGLDGDLAAIFMQTIAGELNPQAFSGNSKAVGVVLASGGYPLSVQKDEEIFGIKDAEKISDVKVFHAGTKIEEGRLLVNGGRVLCVTAKGGNINLAREKAYLAVGKINFKGMQYRKDIGL